MLKKTLISAAVAASLFALSAPASATLTNWYVDTDGAGGNAPVLVHDYLDIVGAAFVNNTLYSATNFTFNEVGRFGTPSTDGGTLLGGQTLSPQFQAYFSGTGSGTAGGNLSFNPGGLLSVFSGANDIANFSLQSGSAVLNANSTLPNGTISLIFKATSMSTGYFFDSAMHDLSLQANSPTGLVLGFATTNAIPLTGNVSTALIGDYNSLFSPTFANPVTPDGRELLYISNNGQFRLSVPEPSILSLLGIALVGVGFSTRRKSQS